MDRSRPVKVPMSGILSSNWRWKKFEMEKKLRFFCLGFMVFETEAKNFMSISLELTTQYTFFYCIHLFQSNILIMSITKNQASDSDTSLTTWKKNTFFVCSWFRLFNWFLVKSIAILSFELIMSLGNFFLSGFHKLCHKNCSF